MGRDRDERQLCLGRPSRAGVCAGAEPLGWLRAPTPQLALPSTHLDAVKTCLELVQAALMGLSWPLISPMGVKLSTFQTLRTPALQALSSIGRPGTKARAHTQSLCALGICCGWSDQ